MGDERYPMSVRLLGVMYKEKKKMYMTSVLWSDSSDILVYRTLKDFQKLHKEMKKAFPPENRLRRSDRVVPKFQVRRLRCGQKKGHAKSLRYLKALQTYWNKLLSCDQRVARSPPLLRFLQPKEQELQADFSRNCVIIMSSDVSDGQGGHGNGGDITNPFVTEMYRCVAAYETKDTKNKTFKVAADEKVDVLVKDRAGWWLVEKEDKRMAWFPAPYLEKMDHPEDEVDTDGISEQGKFYVAVRNYKATNDDEITVNMGSVVEVMQRSDNGWWLVRYRGKAGYLPSMHLQASNYHRVQMTSSNLDVRLTPHLSRSQSGLLQPPPSGAGPSPQDAAATKRLSRSLNNLVVPQVPQAPQPTARTPSPSVAPVVQSPAPSGYAAWSPPPPPPTITVELEGEGTPQVWSEETGYVSDSDLSLSDMSELSSSTTSSTFNLSPGEPRPRLSLTPQPGPGPSAGPGAASVSDPNLYKGPVSPKVPPRPHAQEILSRCSTITRKNLSRGGPPVAPGEVQSR